MAKKHAAALVPSCAPGAADPAHKRARLDTTSLSATYVDEYAQAALDDFPNDIWLEIARLLFVTDLARLRAVRKSLRCGFDAVVDSLIETLVQACDDPQAAASHNLNDLTLSSKYQLLAYGCCRAPVHPAVQQVLRSEPPLQLGTRTDRAEPIFAKNVRVIWNQARTLFAVCSNPRTFVDLTPENAIWLERSTHVNNTEPIIAVFCAQTGQDIACARLRDLYKITSDTFDDVWPQRKMASANDCTCFSAQGDKILLGAAGKIVIWDFRRWPRIAQSPAALTDYRQDAPNYFCAFDGDFQAVWRSQTITSLQTSADDCYLKCTTHESNGRRNHAFTNVLPLIGSDIKRTSSFGAPIPQVHDPHTPFNLFFGGVFKFTDAAPGRYGERLMAGWDSSYDAPFNSVCMARELTVDYNGYDGCLRLKPTTKLFADFDCDVDPHSLQTSACGGLLAALDQRNSRVALICTKLTADADYDYHQNCRRQNLHLFSCGGRVDSVFFAPAGPAEAPTLRENNADAADLLRRRAAAADADAKTLLVTLMTPGYDTDCALFECTDVQNNPTSSSPRRLQLASYSVGRLLDLVLPQSDLCFAAAPERPSQGRDRPDQGWTLRDMAHLGPGGALFLRRKCPFAGSGRAPWWLWESEFYGQVQDPFTEISKYSTEMTFLRSRARQSPLSKPLALP